MPLEPNIIALIAAMIYINLERQMPEGKQVHNTSEMGLGNKKHEKLKTNEYKERRD